MVFNKRGWKWVGNITRVIIGSGGNINSVQTKKNILAQRIF